MCLSGWSQGAPSHLTYENNPSVRTSPSRIAQEPGCGGPPWQDFADDTVSQAQDFRAAASGIMSALRELGFHCTPAPSRSSPKPSASCSLFSPSPSDPDP
jgi:hypothetical protein